MFVIKHQPGWPWLAATLLAVLTACSQSPPEQRLRERIDAMQLAAETGDSSEFMAGVADNFIGNQGMTRQQLRGLLAARKLRYRDIQVRVVATDVRLLPGETQAEVDLDLLLTGGQGLLPEHASTLHVKSGWRDGDDGWQVISAEWDRGL